MSYQSEKVDVVAILTPKEGKIDTVLELLTALTHSVEEKEPDTLRYRVTRQYNSTDGSEDVVVIEQYADQAAFDRHIQSADFKHLAARLKEEGALAKPLVLKFLRTVIEFVRTN